MPLSSQAQKEVDKKLDELYSAFYSGAVYSQAHSGYEELGDLKAGFKLFLETYHQDLVSYLTPELWERIK
jgi:hypothetical protein